MLVLTQLIMEIELSQVNNEEIAHKAFKKPMRLPKCMRMWEVLIIVLLTRL